MLPGVAAVWRLGDEKGPNHITRKTSPGALGRSNTAKSHVFFLFLALWTRSDVSALSFCAFTFAPVRRREHG